jgi:two-component system response regulator HupR/HoxA
MAYDWPGNVRELEQEVRRLLALGDEVIGPEHASPHIHVARAPHAAAGAPPAGPLRDQVDDLERRAIAAALERHGGNKSRVADELGLSRPGLAKKMRRLGLGE